MNIVFSIVTVTFNAAKVLESTLNSVANQTYGGIQHIIVDGASTDGTMDIVRNYHKNHHGAYEVLVKSERDTGLYDAMNKGLKMAHGTYILFLNAGDTLATPSTLKAMAQMLDKYRDAHSLPGILYGNTNIIDGEGRVMGKRKLQPPERLTWRSFSDGMLVCHQAFYVRLDIAQKVQYDLQYKYSADVDWCIRAMKETERRGRELLNTGMTLCNYLDEGMTTAHHKESLWERYKIMCTHYGVMSTTLKHLMFALR
jgi:glycosyltransferase involved in cell wall biosynthesis